MTIYNVSVGNHTYRVDISGNQLFIDGIKEQAKLIRMNAANLFLLSRDRRNVALHVEPQEGQTYAVVADGRRVIAQVQAGEANHTLAKESALESKLVAPMPGLVTAVHVNEGDRVEKGQALVTQESMKMQMELRAPVSGRVLKVSVEPRAQVEKGTLLVAIQPEG